MTSDTPTPAVLASAPEHAVLTVLLETLFVARSALMARHAGLEDGPSPSLAEITPALCLADAVVVHLGALTVSLERYLEATNPRRATRLHEIPY
jgi:hypothetical protein